jgi:hypothetical protein
VLFPGEECLACNWRAGDDDPSEESLPTDFNDRWAPVRVSEDLMAATLAKEGTDAFALRAKARGWPTQGEWLILRTKQAAEMAGYEIGSGDLLALMAQHRAEKEKFEDRCLAALQHHPDGARLLKAKYDTQRKCLDLASLMNTPAWARANEAMRGALSAWFRWVMLDHVKAEYGPDGPTY